MIIIKENIEIELKLEGKRSNRRNGKWNKMILETNEFGVGMRTKVTNSASMFNSSSIHCSRGWHWRDWKGNRKGNGNRKCKRKTIIWRIHIQPSVKRENGIYLRSSMRVLRARVSTFVRLRFTAGGGWQNFRMSRKCWIFYGYFEIIRFAFAGISNKSIRQSDQKALSRRSSAFDYVPREHSLPLGRGERTKRIE